jgi:hypothetical protein
MSSNNIHGLAAKIRSATESETFDLGGLPPGTIEQVIQDAFGSPPWPALPGVDMVRITLVVGAGKQSRQKYHESTPKVVTNTLNSSSCGYVEDRGASNVADCAGTYKVQHDTGKNLKTVVVFPKFVNPKGELSSSTVPLLPIDSMEYKVAACSMTVFNNMIQHKVPSWFQKRNLMQLLEDKIQSPVQELEQLLLQGQILSPAQQELYDACVEIDAKYTAIKQAMHSQVDHGQLTVMEKDFLLEQVQSRIDEAKQSSNGGGSVVVKAQERKAKLVAIQPIALPPLKHAVALGKLWKQAAPLLYLQSKSGQLTLQETKKLGQLDDLLAEIDQLEQDSRGWLEDDEIFSARIQAYRRDLQHKYKTSSMGNSTTPAAKGKAPAGGAARSGGGGGTKKSSTNAWSSSTIAGNTKVQLPTATTWMSAKDKKTQALQSKKAKMKKGDVFGAMMMDSDSSDDEENDEVSTKMNNDGSTRSSNNNKKKSNDNTMTKSTHHDTQSAPSSSSSNLLLSPTSEVSSTKNNTDGNDGPSRKSNKKKKKTNKDSENCVASAGSGQNNNTRTTTAATTTTQEEKSDHIGNVWMNVLYILLHYLFRLVMTILTWMLSWLVGTSKSKTKKKV